jgi:hypothetical protein
MPGQVATNRFTPREERRRTMLQARMRSASGWADACILNLSSNGLLIYSDGAAKPGSFVEVRRGSQLVIARVVWRSNQRIGLCSAEKVCIDALISDETAAAAARTCSDGVRIERRRRPRDADKSRSLGRATEFAFVLTVGIALAGSAAFSAWKALAAPMTMVSSALRHH